MKPWQCTALIFLLALAAWTGLHKLAVRYGPPLTCTPDATLAARLVAAQTRLAQAEATLAPLATDVSEWATQYAEHSATSTPTPTGSMTASTTASTTPTRTPWPTRTPTPMGLLCKACVQGAADGTPNGCGPGYTCWYCPGVGYRCVDPGSDNGSCTTCRNVAGNVTGSTTSSLSGLELLGLATWYNDSVYVATGEYFRPDAMTCAVDVGMWPILAGQSVVITRLDTAASIVVAVNDCGYLARAGHFTYGVKAGQARYWPADTGWEVVVDLSPHAADMLTERETVLVRVKAITGGEP